jgi:hypothetical protein
MDFLKFSAIPFGTEVDMGLVYTRLTDLIGVGSGFDSFTLQNTAWFSLVKKILASVNSEQVMRSYQGGIPQLSSRHTETCGRN